MRLTKEMLLRQPVEGKRLLDLEPSRISEKEASLRWAFLWIVCAFRGHKWFLENFHIFGDSASVAFVCHRCTHCWHFNGFRFKIPSYAPICRWFWEQVEEVRSKTHWLQ